MKAAEIEDQRPFLFTRLPELFMPNAFRYASLRFFRVLLISLLFIAAVFAVSSSSSASAGAIWTKQKSNTLAWLHAVYFLDAQKGFAAGSNGVLLATEDGGSNWRVLRRPSEDALRDVYFSDKQNGWLVCERNIYLLKTIDEPRTYLLRTVDGGATWRRVNVIGANSDERLVRAIFTTGGERGWAFGEQGALYATRNSGANWTRQFVPTRHLLLGGAFIDADQGWLVGAGATILQTTDGGETWRAGNAANALNARLTAASFVDAAHGWAVGADGRILFTKDGGASWRAQDSNTAADLYDVKFVDRVEGWAVGAEGVVLHTTDGGARWLLESSGTTHTLERLCLAGRRRGWAVGYGGTIIAFGAVDKTPQQSAPQLKSGTEL
jgi:photosystem II stability/assembly factor-like uncharacterized protein